VAIYALVQSESCRNPVTYDGDGSPVLPTTNCKESYASVAVGGLVVSYIGMVWLAVVAFMRKSTAGGIMALAGFMVLVILPATGDFPLRRDGRQAAAAAPPLPEPSAWATPASAGAPVHASAPLASPTEWQPADAAGDLPFAGASVAPPVASNDVA